MVVAKLLRQILQNKALQRNRNSYQSSLKYYEIQIYLQVKYSFKHIGSFPLLSAYSLVQYAHTDLIPACLRFVDSLFEELLKVEYF